MLEGTGCSCRLMSTHLVEVELELSLDVCCFVVVFVGGCFVVVSSRSSRRCFVECVLCRVGCDIKLAEIVDVDVELFGRIGSNGACVGVDVEWKVKWVENSKME